MSKNSADGTVIIMVGDAPSSRVIPRLLMNRLKGKVFRASVADGGNFHVAGQHFREVLKEEDVETYLLWRRSVPDFEQIPRMKFPMVCVDVLDRQHL